MKKYVHIKKEFVVFYKYLFRIELIVWLLLRYFFVTRASQFGDKIIIYYIAFLAIKICNLYPLVKAVVETYTQCPPHMAYSCSYTHANIICTYCMSQV